MATNGGRGFRDSLAFQSYSLRGHFAKDGDPSLEMDYFEVLSRQAGGNIQVAADLFAQSLAYRPDSSSEGDESSSQKMNVSHALVDKEEDSSALGSLSRST